VTSMDGTSDGSHGSVAGGRACQSRARRGAPMLAPPASGHGPFSSRRRVSFDHRGCRRGSERGAGRMPLARHPVARVCRMPRFCFRRMPPRRPTRFAGLCSTAFSAVAPVTTRAGPRLAQPGFHAAVVRTCASHEREGGQWPEWISQRR
jgi:hypothetical protein